MASVLKTGNGTNGQLELLEDRIRIKRKGVVAFMGHGLKGDKEILIKQISAIQFKKASNLANGFIQFSFLGGTEAKGGFWQATRDENTIFFRKNHQPDFEEIKNRLDAVMSAGPKGETQPPSSIHDLEKLAELRDKGIITHAEFEAKKKQILNI